MELTKKLKIPMSQRHLPKLPVSSLHKIDFLPSSTSHSIFCTNIIYDYSNPDGVILFGKLRLQNSWRSVSIKVLKVSKIIYFKPIYWEEAEEKLKKLKSEQVIKDYDSRRKTKKIFSNNKTHEVECIKVKYTSHNLSFPSLFPEHHYYTCHDDLVENAILKLDLCVPAWINVERSEVCLRQVTNCKLELNCDSIDCIRIDHEKEVAEKIEEPFGILVIFDIWNDLTLTEIHLKSFFIEDTSSLMQSQLSAQVEKFSYPENFKTEKELINFFLMKIQVYDPDIVIVNQKSELIKKLASKFRNLSIKNWSRIGRIIRTRLPTDNFWRRLVSGRYFIEIDSIAADISEFCSHVFNSKELETAFSISKITKVDLSKILQGGSLGKAEYLIIKTLYKYDYLWPSRKKQTEEKKFKFKGGLVIDPKPGLYDFIVSMDFSSLYPSIIQEYKICITGENLLSQIIANLTSSRSEINNKIANSLELSDKSLLNKQQKALKSFANSIYGCFSNEYFRFYCPSISETIASYGRKVLMDSSSCLLKDLGLDIIYGDTDSIMIASGLESSQKAYEMGKFIETFINDFYKFVKIRVEAVYSKFFLLQKKNYAGILADSSNLVIKGLVRGSNSEFCQLVVKNTLRVLLENGFLEMDLHVMKFIKDIEQVEPGLLMVRNLSNGKNEIKMTKNDEVDTEWYINKEILPFRNKVKQVLIPNDDFYFFCEKKHKVFWFQDGKIVLECKECAGAMNISFSYPNEICQNITTMEIKNRIRELYRQPNKMQKKIIKNCKNFSGSCTKSFKNFNISTHFCEFEKFNIFVNDFRKISESKFHSPSLVSTYNSSSYFRIDLSKYSKTIDYASRILRH